jgi:hypothetical protein
MREFANSDIKMNNSNTSMNVSTIGMNVSTFGIVEQAPQPPVQLNSADHLRQQMLNLAPREVIEQVIFDPQNGIVKREIHFGIIDYLTVSISYF